MSIPACVCVVVFFAALAMMTLCAVLAVANAVLSRIIARRRWRQSPSNGRINSYTMSFGSGPAGYYRRCRVLCNDGQYRQYGRPELVQAF